MRNAMLATGLMLAMVVGDFYIISRLVTWVVAWTSGTHLIP